MYPANYFGLFPPFPREDTVFVAMSFDSCFDNRWSEVIAPAINNVEVNGVKLEPIRVDARQISDSILTEILSKIGNARLIFADISTIGHIKKKAIRNGNVMYEVGIAQAVRLPEEVLLYRSDDDQLPFDLANVRVNSYQPDKQPIDAKSQISDSIISAITELDLRRHLAVSKAAESLDSPSYWLLAQCQSEESITHPDTQTMGQVLGNTSRVAAIRHLLDLGAIQTSYIPLTPTIIVEKGDSSADLITYKITPFGKAIFHECAKRLGLLNLFKPEAP